MGVLDRAGLGPIRKVEHLPDGSVIVHVTPPAWAVKEAVTKSVRLNADQFHRYVAWVRGDGLIQHLLQDLTNEDREVLMNGGVEV